MNKRRMLLYCTACAAFVAATAIFVAFTVFPMADQNRVQSVIVNGDILIGYADSVPVGLTFQHGDVNYSAVFGNTTASCACAGYYYMVTLPNQATFNVYVFYKVDNATRVCRTNLTLSLHSDILSYPVRCP